MAYAESQISDTPLAPAIYKLGSGICVGGGVRSRHHAIDIRTKQCRDDTLLVLVSHDYIIDIALIDIGAETKGNR